MFTESACKNPLTSRATLAEIEEEIKTWLHSAPDCHGGRAVRSAKAKAKAKTKVQQACNNRMRSSMPSRSTSPVDSGRSRSHSNHQDIR